MNPAILTMPLMDTSPTGGSSLPTALPGCIGPLLKSNCPIELTCPRHASIATMKAVGLVSLVSSICCCRFKACNGLSNVPITVNGNRGDSDRKEPVSGPSESPVDRSVPMQKKVRSWVSNGMCWRNNELSFQTAPVSLW